MADETTLTNLMVTSLYRVTITAHELAPFFDCIAGRFIMMQCLHIYKAHAFQPPQT